MPESGPSGFVRGAAVMYVPTAILTTTPTLAAAIMAAVAAVAKLLFDRLADPRRINMKAS